MAPASGPPASRLPAIRDADPARPGDRAAIEAMYDGIQAAELEWEPNRMPPGRCGPHVEGLIDWAARGGFILLAEDEAGPGALLIAGLQDDGGWVLPGNRLRGEISDLFVAPRLRRRGLGLALLQEAERRFRAQGIGRIEIGTLVANAAARALYRRWAGAPNLEIYVRLPD